MKISVDVSEIEYYDWIEVEIAASGSDYDGAADAVWEYLKRKYGRYTDLNLPYNKKREKELRDWADSSD